MRCMLFVLFTLGIAAPLAAQELPAPACQPVAVPGQVVVTMGDGAKLRGTLLCLGEQEVMLAGDGVVTRRALADVRQIAKPQDGVNDGFLKGAAIGLIFWGVVCPRCDAEYMLRSTATYALIGLSLDALQGNGKTIYRGPSTAKSVAFRLRF